MKYLDDIRTFPRDARCAWRWDGAAGVWDEFQARTSGRVFRFWRGTVLAIDLSQAPLTAPPPGVEIRRLAPSDRPALAAVLSRRMLAHFDRAQGLGRICLVAWRGSTPVAYFWCSEGSDPDLHAAGLSAPPGTIYVWYLAVARSERGQRLGLALLHRDLGEARATGFARIGWMSIAAGNRRAIAVARRFAAGAPVELLGQLWMVKLLRWSRRLYRPARPSRAGPLRMQPAGGEGAG